MIPRLLDGSATDFTQIGIPLTDCISCTVQEERNGVFELTAVVSTTTPYFDTIKVGMLIVAKPNHTQDPQAFEIYEISKPINQQVTIRANHISYRQSFIPVKPFSCTGITATLSGLISNAMETSDFTFSTDISNETSTYNQIEPASMRSRLGGVAGSVLDVFGGEYEWDNFETILHLHRGADNGVQLRLGKNITNLEQTESLERVVTGVLPYWSNSDGTLQYYGDIQYSSAVGDYPTHRTIVLDLSSDFESAPTKTQLNNAGQAYLAQSNLATPNTNVAVQFIDLADTTEYADSPLERVNLCDTVEVIYPALDISYKAKAIKVVFDVLAERTLEVEVGDTRSTISKTIADVVGDIDSQVKLGNKLVSVTQKIDREVGEISTTIGEIEEDVSGVTERVTQVEQDTDSIKLRVDNSLTNESQQFHLSTSSSQLAYAQLTPGSTKIVGSGIAPLSSSQVSTIRTAAWSDNAPKLLAGTWLWGREKLAHTDSEGTVTYTYGEPYLWEAISDNAYQGSAINMYADRIQLQVTEQKSDIAKNATGIAENKSFIEQTSKDITARVEEVYADERSNYAQLSVSLDSISSSVYKEIKDTGDNLQKQIDGFNNYTTDDIKGLITNEIQTDDTIKDLVGFKNKNGETIELASTMLDANGFHVETANTNNSVTITGDGLTVIDKDDETLLSATDDGVDMKDATVRNYLNIDYSTYGFRFETYSDSNDSNQLGIYGW